MRILYCNKYNYAFSGTEAYLFEAMDLLSARGHKVALFSMADSRGRRTAYDSFLVPAIDFKNQNRGFLEQAKLAGRAVYSWDARRRLRRMIAQFRPDVAHVRNIYHHLTPSILWELKKQGVPVLYHLNDFKLLCPTYNLVSKGHACERCRGGKFLHVLREGCSNGPRGSALVLAAEAYFHKWLRTYETCVDLFLAPSEFVKNKLLEHGWPAGKIQVLPHFQRVPPTPPPAPPRDAPILYFGRLSPEKGVDDLLRAMQRLPHLTLQIAGDGPQRPDLENLAQRLSLQNVEFLGQVKKAALSDRIASSRFTVFPSHAYETLGKSILESYAEARAVVASDLGSRRELVREGNTGLLFPAGDSERLAAAIAQLAEHPQRAREMGLAGRALVQREYTPDSHYASLLRLYAGLRKAATVSEAPAKPHIAFIGGRGVLSKYSGIEAFYEEAGKRLVESGYRITVYCRTYFTPPVREYAGMEVVRLPSIRSKHLETLTHTLLSTLHAIFHDCDVVHYHTLGPALFSLLPRLVGKKTIVSVQGLDWRRKKWGRFAALMLRLGERASVRFPNATIVVSRTLQNHFRSRHRVETLYVPNGTRLLERRPDARALTRWNLEPGRYVLFLGRLSPEKNCHLLIEAYERLSTDVKLVLAGGSSHSDDYVEALRRHESERIRMPGWVSGADLEDLISHAMLFVLPSDLEGLSLALLDAMGAGVCVLASAIPENREAMEGAGFTFRPGDAGDLARMLQLLISNRELREKAARRGQWRARERYLWPDVVSRLDQIYCSVVDAQKDSQPIPISEPELDIPSVAA